MYVHGMPGSTIRPALQPGPFDDGGLAIPERPVAPYLAIVAGGGPAVEYDTILP